MRTDSTYFRTAASADSGLQVVSCAVVSATVAATINLRVEAVGGAVICRIICPANDTRTVHIPSALYLNSTTDTVYVEINAGTAEVTLFGR